MKKSLPNWHLAPLLILFIAGSCKDNNNKRAESIDEVVTGAFKIVAVNLGSHFN